MTEEYIDSDHEIKDTIIEEQDMTISDLRQKLDIAFNALKDIYADGSYKDIASQMAKEAIDKIEAMK